VDFSAESYQFDSDIVGGEQTRRERERGWLIFGSLCLASILHDGVVVLLFLWRHFLARTISETGCKLLERLCCQHKTLANALALWLRQDAIELNLHMMANGDNRITGTKVACWERGNIWRCFLPALSRSPARSPKYACHHQSLSLSLLLNGDH